MPTLFEKRNILVLDDDSMVSRIVEKATGIKTMSCLTLESLKDAIASAHPIAAFVDINLENQSCGLDAIPLIRKAWLSIPIIVITSCPAEISIRNALSSGANDFMRKPLNLTEVALRLQLRLTEFNSRKHTDCIFFGDLVIDIFHRRVSCNKRSVDVSEREMSLLLLLINAEGIPVTKEAIRRKIWGKTRVSVNSIDRKIFELRRVLEELESRTEIRSLYGVGLILEDRQRKRKPDDMEKANPEENQEILSQNQSKLLQIDLSKLRSLRALTDASDQIDFLDELIAHFSLVAPQKSNQIKEALKSKDKDLARSTAHSLKGSAAELGLEEVTDICQTLENALSSAQTSGDAHTLDLLQRKLSSCLEASITELHQSWLTKTSLPKKNLRKSSAA